MRKILTIAGSDSGGGAGIQADLKTITVLGGYGMSAITALTAQNTLGVQGVHPVPVDFIRQQMTSVLSDYGADGAKTGMLATPEIVVAVAEQLKKYRVKGLVVDPVMVAKGGDVLLSREARVSVKEVLLPMAYVVTPNLPEAADLCGFPVADLESMKAAAEKIHGLGTPYVLVKGGHLKGDAVDLLFDGSTFRPLRPASRQPEYPRHRLHLFGGPGNSSGAGITVPEAVAQAKHSSPGHRRGTGFRRRTRPHQPLTPMCAIDGKE
jgi:hydroxymethylpyrimidine kinase/phosphomethylpyrimidine kinase